MNQTNYLRRTFCVTAGAAADRKGRRNGVADAQPRGRLCGTAPRVWTRGLCPGPCHEPLSGRPACSQPRRLPPARLLTAAAHGTGPVCGARLAPLSCNSFHNTATALPGSALLNRLSARPAQRQSRQSTHVKIIRSTIARSTVNACLVGRSVAIRPLARSGGLNSSDTVRRKKNIHLQPLYVALGPGGYVCVGFFWGHN